MSYNSKSLIIPNVAIKDAKEAQELWWNDFSNKQRAQIFLKASSILKSKFKDIVHAEVTDTGRKISEIETYDVPSASHILSYHAHLPAILTNGSVYDVDPSLLSFTRREPFGLTVGIGAWNFPFLNAIAKSAPALICGNAMLYKPSELTPTTSLILAEIYQKAGLPDGVFQVLLGDGSVASQLIDSEEIRKISFTGSIQTGKEIYVKAAENFQRVTLEMGGKSPLILMSDCDIDAAVQGAISANWYANGQVCSNGTRVFVHESIRDEFLARLVLKTKGLKIGDPMDKSIDIGPMISKSHLKKVTDYIKIGVEIDGATLLYGGEKMNLNGNFISPCIFVDCEDNMRIVQEEVFGMLMSVLTFKDEEDVVRRANATHFGLAAGIYSKDTAKALRMSKKLHVGTVYINTYNEGHNELPWGGVKKSGIGKEGGGLEQVYHEWTECKAIYAKIC